MFGLPKRRNDIAEINQRMESIVSGFNDIIATLEDLRATHARLFAAFIAQSEAAKAARSAEMDDIIFKIKTMQAELLAKLPSIPVSK